MVQEKRNITASILKKARQVRDHLVDIKSLKGEMLELSDKLDQEDYQLKDKYHSAMVKQLSILVDDIGF